MDNPQESVCSICLQSIKTLIKCNRCVCVYHQKCINSWITQCKRKNGYSECPACKNTPFYLGLQQDDLIEQQDDVIEIWCKQYSKTKLRNLFHV